MVISLKLGPATLLRFDTIEFDRPSPCGTCALHLFDTLSDRQNDSSLEESVSPSPTQRRLSPERTRSTSPTKGLGGFVQSAMMRNHSVEARASESLTGALATPTQPKPMIQRSDGSCLGWGRQCTCQRLRSSSLDRMIPPSRNLCRRLQPKLVHSTFLTHYLIFSS
jgi:hypothetical protein